MKTFLRALVLASLAACAKQPSTGSGSTTASSAAGSTAGASAGSSSGSSGSTGSTGGTGSTGATGSTGSGSSGGSSGSGSTTGASCDVHLSGPSHFTDETGAWGLAGVYGNRLMAADLDGDGYPDLIIHAITTDLRSNADLPDGGHTDQLVHVMMNRPSPDGGRTFVDQTLESGIFQLRDVDGGAVLRAANLAIAGDVDNDGDLDLFSGTYVDPTQPDSDPGDRSEILLNDGTGHFSLAPISAPHPSAAAKLPTTGATFLDADRDGKLDLFVGFWYADYGAGYQGVQAQLYQGVGDGTFNAVTNNVGLRTFSSGFDSGLNHRPAYGVTSCDLDGDGAPELMVSAYGRQWNLLYLNDGTGHFTEVGQNAGYAGDDNRNFSDDQFHACYCTVHTTAADCQGVAQPLISCPTPADAYWQAGVDDQPWRLNGNTFTTVCRDFDGDGKPDLISAEIHHWHVGQSADSTELLVSQSTPGSLHFVRPGNAATGLIQPHPTSDWNEGDIHAAAADLDNDGRPDFILGQTDYPDQYGLIYHQKPDHTFEEVGQAWGIHHPCLSGLAVADFDGDGDLDIVVGSGTARDCSQVWSHNEVHLYQNDASQRGHWLVIKLRGDGVTANRAGIGAKVEVTAGGETQMQELGGGYGHMAMQNDLVLFYGLGGCGSVDQITVRWPDRAMTTQTFTNVGANRVIELRQGDPAVH